MLQAAISLMARLTFRNVFY